MSDHNSNTLSEMYWETQEYWNSLENADDRVTTRSDQAVEPDSEIGQADGWNGPGNTDHRGHFWLDDDSERATQLRNDNSILERYRSEPSRPVSPRAMLDENWRETAQRQQNEEAILRSLVRRVIIGRIPVDALRRDYPSRLGDIYRLANSTGLRLPDNLDEDFIQALRNLEDYLHRSYPPPRDPCRVVSYQASTDSGSEQSFYTSRSQW